MNLLNISSPHTTRPGNAGNVMLTVIYALIPGIAVLSYYFGPGHFIQICLASLVALSGEAVILKLRKKPVLFNLKDFSALLTALLLAISLPPYTPFWVTITATLFAIVIAKHLYGGLGQNPFNPAMVGFALVLVSFPVEMTTSWSAPSALLETGIGFGQALELIFSSRETIDAVTMATPLDLYKNQVQIATASEIYQNPIFNGPNNEASIALGWQWVNMAFLLGGAYLLWKRVFTWHIPVSLLLSLSLLSIFIGWDSDRYVPISLHLFAGATMLGAFFIATDPVTASTTPMGKIIYGAGIGILIYVIRTFGAYPDAVAFAILLMNFAAPLIDQYSQPRTYGHKKAARGLATKHLDK